MTLLLVELYHLAVEVMERVEKENFYGQTVTVKVKYADFKVITRSKTLPCKITAFNIFWSTARGLLKEVDVALRPVRLLGVGLSNAVAETKQKAVQLTLDLFPPER